MSARRLSDHAVIIGGSLAGTTTAIELARAGVPVTLIDRELFPRRKPCGEGLSARGRLELLKAGFDIETAGCAFKTLQGYRIYKGRSQLSIPEESGITGIARTELDTHLLAYAGTLPSLRIIQGNRAEIIESTGSSFTILIGRDTITTNFLVIADGSQSPTLRALGQRLPINRHARLGTSSTWEITAGTLPDYVHSIFVPGGEIYLTPVSPTAVNISALGHRSLIQPLAQDKTLQSRIAALSALLGVSLRLRTTPLGCGPINTSYRGAHYCGAFIVGDACETFDPCAGFGMTHAIVSGRLAARHITRALDHSNIATELSAYERCREHSMRDIRGFTRLTSMATGSSVGRMCLPFLVSSGLVATVSHSVHSPHEHRRVRRLVSLLGAAA